MDRHAYIITANGNLLVLETCLRLIDDSRNDVFVLFDKKAKINNSVKEKLKHESSFSNVFFLPDQNINWGGVSQIKAELRLLDEVVKHEVLSGPYSFIHYLQGADLPLKPQDEIHSYFDARKGKQFVSFNDEDESRYWSRSQFYHFLADFPSFRHCFFLRAIDKMLVVIQKVLGVKRNKDLELYSGSALWSITSEFAHYLVSNENEITKRFKASLTADEVFVQTFLMRSQYKDEIAHEGNMRLINWQLPHPKNSPHTWEKKDWPLLQEGMAGALFARKFSQDIDMCIVMLVEDRIIGTHANMH